jgi:hypothetical protein
MSTFISPFDGTEHEYIEDLHPFRAPILGKKFISIDQSSPQNFLMYSVVKHSINDGIEYTTLSENLFHLHLGNDNNIFILGNAGGEDDGIDAIAQAEKYKDGYAINIIGKTQKPKFPNREEKDLIIALSKSLSIYSGEVVNLRLFQIWKELSDAGIPILIHDVFDEFPDQVITSDELIHYFDPTIDTTRFRFKIGKSK